MLSASFDGTARLHGLKSGKTLKEFRGHTSYVNDAQFSPDGARVLTASSDGSVRVWDAKTCECVSVLAPPAPAAGVEGAVLSTHVVPSNPDLVVVCSRGPALHVMTLGTGQLVRSLGSGKREKGDFVAAALSPRGEWAYALGEDGQLYCFSLGTGKLEHLLPVAERDPVGLCHHPHRNLVATFSGDGLLKMWKP